MPEQSKKYDVVTFGETMLRLSPPGFGRIEDAISLDVRIGGSESNTAVGLSRLGLKASWFSKLPMNPLGRRIENEIHRWGVDTSAVIWDDSPDARAGLYFLDFGLPPRPTDVYYDRANSSASKITALEIESSPIADARLLHLSGITPALSPYALKAVSRAISIAKENNVLISFDINYRSKLWSTAKARETLTPLLGSINLLMCPDSDARSIFDINGTGHDMAREFRASYGVGAVVITMGGEGAVAQDSSSEHFAKPFELKGIVDRVGAGDAFNSGILMGFLEGNLELGLRYGVAMAALKHTIPGDLLISTRAEIDSAAMGGLSGINR